MDDGQRTYSTTEVCDMLDVSYRMAVVWQGIYLGAIVRTDVRNVRTFPTEPVRAPKGTITTSRLARPYDWANE